MKMVARARLPQHWKFCDAEVFPRAARLRHNRGLELLDQTEGYVTADGRKIGGVVMDMRNITLRFGGVEAIKNISFDIREGEIRAIIGPNGAGKSSMLNVISGFYVPQEGEVWFHGAKRAQMKPYQVAQQGIARTFQNIALFEGMSVLDNVMTGRLNNMKTNLLQQAFWRGAAEREEVENREICEKVIDFLEIQHIRKTPVVAVAIWFEEAGRTGARIGIRAKAVVVG
jgi:branched-chain amino acid transport system ATP-binding protein